MSNQTLASSKVNYISMKEGTQEDYLLMAKNTKVFEAHTTERVLEYLKHLEGIPGEQVDCYGHSLQTATRAHRDGADEETVVSALLHDVGIPLAPAHHEAIAAAILRPFVSWETHWMVQHHGIFQGYYYFHHIGKNRNERDKYRGHPAYARTVEFCERWDQTSFDPDYDTMPLTVFEPMVARVFGRGPWGARTKAP